MIGKVKQMGMKQKILFISLFILMVLGVSYFGYIRPMFSFGMTYGQVLPIQETPDFLLHTLSGDTIKLSDYYGQTVFLSFWNTQSPYACGHLKRLTKAQEKLSKEKLGTILTVNVEEQDAQVIEYLIENKIILPVLMDKDGQVTRTYGLEQVPVTFIINPDGTIYNGIQGPTNSTTILSIARRMLKQ